MFNKNINTFTDKHKKDPDNIHIVYYLAQNYYSSQLFKDAIKYYKKFISLHCNKSPSSVNKVKIIDSYIKLGKCYMYEDNLNEAFKHIWIAYEYSDNINPLLLLSEHYISIGRYTDAYYILKIAGSSSEYYKGSNSRNQEYISCQYNILMSRSTSALCKYEECYNSCQTALTFLYKNPSFNLYLHHIHNLDNLHNLHKNTNIANIANRAELIDELTDRCEKNRDIIFKQVYRQYSSKPVVLFYCEYLNHKRKWNGFSINDKNSLLKDYQISTILLAEELHRNKYKVIVCCDTEERVWVRGVEYIRISDYDCMLKTYILDHLVLSTYSNSLKHRPNIKNTYLWYHTVNPGNVYIDIDDTKLKSIIVLSEYHKNQVLDLIPYNLHNLIRVIDYSITEKSMRYNLLSKIRLRFMYLMYANEYPDKIIQLFIKIKNIYPQATLDLFLMIDDNFINKSKHLKQAYNNIEKDIVEGIFIHKNPNREYILTKMISSDYWIYSSFNKVEGAYCLSALGAQASGCICIYPDIGSLSEIIGNRGVKIDTSDDEEIINSICFLEENINMKDDIRQESINWTSKQTYKHRVVDWTNMFDSSNSALNIYI